MISSLPALQEFISIKRVCYLYVFDSFSLFFLDFIFVRTKAEPPIYYAFAKPVDEDATVVEQQREQVSSGD